MLCLSSASSIAIDLIHITSSIEIESPDEKRVAVERTKKVAIGTFHPLPAVSLLSMTDCGFRVGQC